MIMNSGILIKTLAILSALLIVGCSKGETGRSSVATPVASPSPQSSSTPDQAIRMVDFDNLAYPNFPDYTGPDKKLLTLKPGEGGPNFISYGDVTGDGVEEAMVALGVDNSGTAITYYVYIFTLTNGKPKLIWDFETGDRADGGLRNIYADKGQLVIELFGKDRVIGGHLYGGDEGLCCPSSFTKTHYRWTGKSFAEVSKEVLKNTSGDANSVMPRYSPAN